LCFIGDKIQNVLKTLEPITPNMNKTLLIGIIKMVKQIFEELHIMPVLELKHYGHSLSSHSTGL